MAVRAAEHGHLHVLRWMHSVFDMAVDKISEDERDTYRVPKTFSSERFKFVLEYMAGLEYIELTNQVAISAMEHVGLIMNQDQMYQMWGLGLE